MNYHPLISVKVVGYFSKCHLTAPYQNIKLTFISTTSSQEPPTLDNFNGHEKNMHQRHLTAEITELIARTSIV